MYACIMLRLELTTFSRRVSMSMSVCPPHRTQTGRRSNNNNILCKREAQRSLSAVSPHTVRISDSIRVMLLPEEEQTKHVVLSHRHLAFHEAAQPDRGAEPAIKPSRWGKFSPRLSRAHLGKIIIVSTNYHKTKWTQRPLFLSYLRSVDGVLLRNSRRNANGLTSRSRNGRRLECGSVSGIRKARNNVASPVF